MGDGRVALILDVPGLAQKAKVIAEAHESARDDAHGETSVEAGRDEHALLLAENGLEGRVAIPLSIVARLEEFPRTVVERAGTQEVMQYRGQIIPLVRLSQSFPAPATRSCWRRRARFKSSCIPRENTLWDWSSIGLSTLSRSGHPSSRWFRAPELWARL